MNRVKIDVSIEELILTSQQMDVAAIDPLVTNIREERENICKAQVANAIWKLSDILIKANAEAIKEFAEEPLWSLEHLGIECQTTLKEKGIERPEIV